MSQERWHTVEDLFHAALERPREQRQQWLDGACNGDAELRRQVEQLLSNEGRAGSFLERPAIEDVTVTHTAAGSLLGRKFGPYEIASPLGAGGMGEVYRAHDGKLGRDVAIKTLPYEFARDPERLARFRREARTLASLNHPNIAAIYGLEESDVDCLVLELVEGETLHGPLPVAQALDRVRQVAEALEAAHASGIIHRDLKPSNVKVTPQGRVKVLDFGLAKGIWGPERNQDPSPMATENGSQSLPGHIVGTPGYMSPEQATGGDVDERTDIWAFGCLLYELLTGQRAFSGESSEDTIAAVLEREPDWNALPAKTPAKIRQLLRQCLQKDAGRRLQHIADARRTIEEGQRGSRRWQIVAAGAAVAIVALVTALWVRGQIPGSMSQSASKARVIRSIAVLPMENFSSDPNQEYFADGMTDELTTDLAKISALRVISRGSVVRFRGPHRPSTPEIAKLLNVDAVVEGTVLRIGDKVRITAQLIDAHADKHLWAESYERDSRDVLALQDELASAIARAVNVELTLDERQRLAPAKPINPDALDACLKGSYYLRKRTRDGFQKARQYYERAIKIDPNFAPGYVGLASMYLVAADLVISNQEAMPKAREQLETALRLDDSYAAAHSALAGVHCSYEYDWAAAERENLRAIALTPGDADAHASYGFMLSLRGRFDEAEYELKLAQLLSPLAPDNICHMGRLFIYRGQYQKAMEQYRRALQIDPNYWLAHSWLGRSYELMGDHSGALKELQNGVAVEPTPVPIALLAYEYAKLGNREQARKLLEQLNRLSSQLYVSPYLPAMVYLALGEKTTALDLLEKGYQERTSLLCRLKVDPDFNSLHSDPRFIELLKKVGLSDESRQIGASPRHLSPLDNNRILPARAIWESSHG